MPWQFMDIPATPKTWMSGLKYLKKTPSAFSRPWSNSDCVLDGLKTGDFLEPEQIIQLGYPPVRIDLLTSLAGVDFPSCHKGRLEVDLDGLNVDFIGLDDLKKNKQAAGRLQDLADLESLS